MPVEQVVQPCTLETFDTAIYNWLNDELDLSTKTNKGFKKVPVIWSGAERAYQIKHSPELRDLGETIILPVISIKRTAVLKDPARAGRYGGGAIIYSDDRRKNVYTVAKRIQPEKTRNFANAAAKRVMGQKNTNRFDNKAVVYEFISIPTPTWVHLTYDIILRTEYQQQMNTLLTPFINRYGNLHTFVVGVDANSFEAFVDQNFTTNNNVADLNASERRFETTINIRLEGSLIGEGENQVQQTVSIRENQVKVRFGKEKTIFEP